jgi:hypothetical protein
MRDVRKTKGGIVQSIGDTEDCANAVSDCFLFTVIKANNCSRSD